MKNATGHMFAWVNVKGTGNEGNSKLKAICMICCGFYSSQNMSFVEQGGIECRLLSAIKPSSLITHLAQHQLVEKARREVASQIISAVKPKKNVILSQMKGAKKVPKKIHGFYEKETNPWCDSAVEAEYE